MAHQQQKGHENDKAIVKTEGFGAIETRAQQNTSALAIAEHTKALVSARCIMAERNPRSWMDIRSKMLETCRRPRFAESSRYKKPQGRKKNEETGRWETNYVEGFSIRFAEAALQCMKNIDAHSQIVFEDDDQVVVAVNVTDYESNTSVSSQIIVSKTVERKELKEGQRALYTRRNSKGDTVFVVPATDDEVRTKMKALISKDMRDGILRLLPADIKEECEEVVEATKASADKADPDAAKKRLIDAFAKVGVKPSSLEKWLGHEVDTISPAELNDLRGVFQAMAEGVSWNDLLDLKTGNVGETDEEKAKAQGTAAVLDKVKAEQAAKAQEKGKGKPPAQGKPKDAGKAAPQEKPAEGAAPPESKPATKTEPEKPAANTTAVDAKFDDAEKFDR